LVNPVAIEMGATPVTVSISADPESIQAGESLTLTWSSTDADSCVIEPGIGDVDVCGSITVSPTETTTYTITATGPGGTAAANAVVTVVDVPYAPTATISANPATISQGESTLLSWASTNADTAHIDNGVGVVSVDGSVLVSPEHTTTYTFTATGSNGSGNAKVTVMVTGDPDPQPERSFGQQYEDLAPPDATIEEYDPKRFSVITGQVLAIDDSPIAGVSVTLHGHPEYGTAATDAGGRFSIPVEGGGTLSVLYHKQGLISSQRQVYVPWNDIAICETIQMIEEDPEATAITFDGNPDTIVTHRSTEVTDDFGARSCSMVFTGDNRAYLVDEEGNDVHELTSIITRATEFTTPESMPAVLPPNVAYTYCADLTVDGADRVRFEKPVVTWVDNFLDFDVGMIVPVGYYDRDRDLWVPSDNGVVVKLLDTDSDGVVDALDSDGDDLPDDLNNNESFSDETIGLENPMSYPPDATLWRVEVTHFTAWDLNWPFGPILGAEPPGGNDFGEPDVDEQKPDSCKLSTGSFVEEKNRIFHEDISIPGTNMALHYASNRVEGYQTLINFPISGKKLPGVLKRIEVIVEVAGNTFKQTLDSQPDLEGNVTWDGLDYLGRPVNNTKALVSVGYVYDSTYWKTLVFSGPGKAPTPILGREEATLWKRNDLKVHRTTASDGFISGGWTISTQHYLDLSDISILNKGDGTIEKHSGLIIDAVAGTGASGYSGDGGPATEAKLYYPYGVAVDSSGNLYIADYLNNRVRKVDTTGTITTVAGSERGYGGDGGPATEANLSGPRGIAVDSSGNIYIADTGNLRVRKVDTTGTITTVAGNGESGLSGYGGPSIGTNEEGDPDTEGNGDGGPATEAKLSGPHGVVVDSSGYLYIVDYQDHCVRKVDTTGIITTLAGNGESGYSGDGGPATEAKLSGPCGIAADLSGNIYIGDTFNNRIRKVDTTGIITTVAGNGEYGYSGDGGPATEAKLSGPYGVAVDPSGNIYIGDTSNNRIRKVDTTGIIATVAGNGEYGYSGDGGSATEAKLSRVLCVLLWILRAISTLGI
jgi:hypothetical protein